MKSVSYRKHAQDCLATAKLVTSEESRALLLSQAECWHRLAQEAEGIERANVVCGGDVRATLVSDVS